MPVPATIPIAHEPGSRTATIGRYADGQFLATVTYAFPEGYRPDDGWEEHKRLYAVLHTFDAAGRYRDSEIRCAGTWAEGAELDQAQAYLDKLLSALEGRTTGDISVRPFRLAVEGVVFGLIVEDDDWVELYPDRLGFGEPWDGSYDA
ncbi:hypothetical protein [Streptomyces sp. NPDC046821]|uniref:hypothetical protein n=1 Tax=Streptomyces sp. NPDC046821 TaxID=3154702 RepID=UPI0033D57B5D